MQVSVIIPAYNSEKTLRETISSVLNQTFSNFELIVIDGGSTDSTLGIISSIHDFRLRVFSYSNLGISASRNCGIAHSNGEFIAFLDHDDLWTPDKLELQLRALRENPQAAVAYSWIDVIDESNQFIRSGIRVSVTDNARTKLLVNNFLYTASNPLIRKEALIEVGGFDESLSGPEDWDLFLRLSSHYQFITVPHSLILFRRSAGSVSSNTSMMEAAALQVINRAFEQSPESLHLKKYSLSTLYLYLTFKGLDAPSQRRNGFVAARHLWQAIKADPSLLRQWKTMLKALFKITAAVFLPGMKWASIQKVNFVHQID